MTTLKTESPFIALSGVSKTYRTGNESLPIFTNLDMTIQGGDFVAVMGPSGSGKSTLLNLLAGIDHADTGDIQIAGQRLDHMGEAARAAWRAHHLGIVFQFYNLLPMLTAAENVELPLLLKPIPASVRRERVAKVLDLVGLGGRGKQNPTRMSGGQQQRVSIARAIVADPSLLLCDEPTGDLDRKSADDVLAMLGYLNRELGKTIVMVTHDPEAANAANRTLHLDKGVFVENEQVAA
ncbi:ABC transporter ATP-binding protein [uncultured Tateyamaria sp.]|uniref:ABC transporter ATP-binding protein n=1 Tax=uncultured Tateyamaria sp. TaxID=455651 RepID=UPI0026087DF0|nr:ABC transporter ATP-binding protein [uncultured Tateyamaria sp.]